MKKIIICTAILFSMAIGYLNNSSKQEENPLLLTDVEALSVEGDAASDDSFNPYCYNGGKGSASCSIEGGITIAGYGVSGGCSVSCHEGYYACCGIRCTCKS